MKNATGKLFLLCILSLYALVPVLGQVSISLDDKTVQPGEKFILPVKVSNYNNILSTQFFLRWDPAILSFEKVVDIHSPFKVADNFGIPESDEENDLSFVWYETGSLSGINIEDDSTMFSIEFTVKGAFGEFSRVEFYEDTTNVSTITEVVDTSFSAIDVDLQDAVISVGETVDAVYNNAPDKIDVQACYPNPFAHHTTLSFSLTQSTTIRLSILDLQGKTVFEEQEYYGSGQHDLNITKDIFDLPGTYFIHLTSPDFKVTQKLVFLNQ